jgi:cobalt-zinc-cadmium efflux system membrane fusion protein
VVVHAASESDLDAVRLTAEAAHRLAIQTARVDDLTVRSVRLTSGEVIIPPGQTLTVSAPVGGELRAGSGAAVLAPGATVKRGEALLRIAPFAPVDRDIGVRAEREVSATAAQLKAADARVTRLSQLGADKAVSRKVYEEAVAARDTLRADVDAAAARAKTIRQTPLLSDAMLIVRAPSSGVLRAVYAAAGQAVTSGTALLEIVAVEALQVRATVYAGDLTQLDTTQAARVRALSGKLDSSVEAQPVEGPPTANPERSSVDRYYALPTGLAFVPGERVLVELPLRLEENARTLPRSALVYDALGAGWVYTCDGEHTFRRARLDPVRIVGDQIVFARGPARGTCVATVGAVEIFGSEFPPGH